MNERNQRCRRFPLPRALFVLFTSCPYSITDKMCACDFLSMLLQTREDLPSSTTFSNRCMQQIPALTSKSFLTARLYSACTRSLHSWSLFFLSLAVTTVLILLAAGRHSARDRLKPSPEPAQIHNRAQSYLKRPKFEGASLTSADFQSELPILVLAAFGTYGLFTVLALPALNAV